MTPRVCADCDNPEATWCPQVERDLCRKCLDDAVQPYLEDQKEEKEKSHVD